MPHAHRSLRTRCASPGSAPPRRALRMHLPLPHATRTTHACLPAFCLPCPAVLQQIRSHFLWLVHTWILPRGPSCPLDACPTAPPHLPSLPHATHGTLILHTYHPHWSTRGFCATPPAAAHLYCLRRVFIRCGIAHATPPAGQRRVDDAYITGQFYGRSSACDVFARRRFTPRRADTAYRWPCYPNLDTAHAHDTTL